MHAMDLLKIDKTTLFGAVLFCCTLMLSASAQATPPVLDIAGTPLTAPCVPAGAHLLQFSAPLLAPTAGLAFQSSFDLTDDSGHFERYALVADSGGMPSATAPDWDAGAILTGKPGQPATPAPSRRNIYTAIVQPDGRLTEIPFQWSALSPAQRALLDMSPPLPPPTRSKADGLGEQRLAFLRGERLLEGTPFRRRSSVLGDAVNSTPVHVGLSPGTGSGADYVAFYERSKTRRGMVYLGANDGMLHGFDARDGSEVFAYVPDALITALNLLTSPFYVHRAYVDGPASAGEALLGTQWKTVLVSGMGGGAQGVFAIDVTDPERLAAGSGVLWEFTDRDDPMMGNVTSLPQIARLRVQSSKGASVYRYFAVVASGLNNYADDGHRSTAGNGALFLLALDKPRDAAWQLNVNYYRLVTPISDPSLANALYAPALVADGDGALRYAYAGDLQGNLWRFDFSGDAPWKSAVGPGAGKTPLFTARDASGGRQPIAQQLRVAYATGGGYLVLFGTGRAIEKSDLLPPGFAVQSYYGILDSLADPAVVVGSRRELTQRVLHGAADAAALTISGGDIPHGSKGWYVDFIDAADIGERSVSGGVLADGLLVFNTLLPGASACSPAQSRTYALNALTGLNDGGITSAAVSDSSGSVSAGSAVIGVLQASYAAAIAILPQASTSYQRVATGQISFQKNVAITGFGTDPSRRVVPLGRAAIQVRAGRLSWREIANWRELHAATKK